MLIREMAYPPIWPIGKKANALTCVTLMHSSLIRFLDPEQKLV